MARFVFDLQAVLDQRVREERERQRELAVQARAQAGIEARVAQLQALLRDERATLSLRLGPSMGSAEGARMDLRAVREQAGASLHLERLLREAAVDLAAAAERCEAARGRLASSAARRRATELLRDRRRAEWSREQRRREAAALDDLTNARHGRGGLAA